MKSLRVTIESLASQFASSVVEAIRGASIDELLDVTQGSGAARRGRPRAEAAAPAAPRRRARGGRLGRRSMGDIARVVEQIVELLQKNPEGLRAEQIREALGVEARELPRPLTDAMSSGRVSKTGQKRATTYFAGSGEGGAPKRRAKRTARAKKK